MGRKGGKYKEVLAGKGKAPSKRDINLEQRKLDIINDTDPETRAPRRTTPPTASELAAMWQTQRQAKEELEDALKIVNFELEALADLLVNAYEAEGMDSIRMTDTGKAVRTQQEPHIVVEDEEAWRQWCVENGMERKLMLWPATRDSLVKDMLLQGSEDPPGIKTYSRTKVVWGA